MSPSREEFMTVAVFSDIDDLGFLAGPRMVRMGGLVKISQARNLDSSLNTWGYFMVWPQSVCFQKVCII